MEKQELDSRITEAARTVRSYCMARTTSVVDAEDLAQDIVVEIYKSAANIRSTEAFYGFMWAVAGNVYRQWCKTKAKRQFCQLTESVSCETSETDGGCAEVQLLRREMTLLDQKYRKAVILYYIERKSCKQIAAMLSVSESMVKYLLFKSRHILKEGMSMERTYGQQSYHPKNLMLQFWGRGPNRCYHLCDSRISQNILFACYHDKLTAEQIALEIGIALPYMEDKLEELYEGGLLNKEGKRYSANIGIFTKQLQQEVRVKTFRLKQRITDLLMEALETHESTIRDIPFIGVDMGENAFAWQITCRLLYSAIIENLQSRVQLNYPNDRYGSGCFVWGLETDEHDEENKNFNFGVSNAQNKSGDYVQFMDFPINGEMVHFFFAFQQHAVNVFLDIAKDNTAHFSENDLAQAAELVKRGYVIQENGSLRLNVPVFTSEQHQQVKEILAQTVDQITDEAEKLMNTVTNILKEHLPLHLKKQAADLAYLRLFDDAIRAPVAELFDRKFLLAYHDGLLPTTYVILK